jgi:hypothetical protein
MRMAYRKYAVDAWALSVPGEKVISHAALMLFGRGVHAAR